MGQDLTFLANRVFKDAPGGTTGGGLAIGPGYQVFSSPPFGGTAVAAGTAAAKSVTISTPGDYGALIVVLNTTTASAGNTVTVAINGLTTQGYSYNMLTSAAIQAVTTTTLRVGLGITAATNLAANDGIPPSIQIVTTIAGTVAYGVDYLFAT
jgi:hypothetical protein